ncbi:hypothetical protein N7462_003505 [Penicillium macrosclerotiorum]|uniref:uncharacterized protein n=1 Tax=Penicillium macrosclerotiorum TaxID=303699 RepID=UPI0025486E41|nr:uncharacterized protein N7462_003505 [Penicillium macrosclerotiorum]KAJ5689113.1 hypothetical protein N7462_003505 [Penicillium macrosclerotiorum]
MQVSLPLALHLRSPQTYNFLTDEHWKPGEKFHRRSLNDLAFIDAHSGRIQATVLFADILRAIFDHPDWSQLYDFFSARYSKEQGQVDSAIRTLHPPKEQSTWKKPTVIAIKTDCSSVGLPKDFPALLATAGETSRSGLMGPDPQPCAIGPAIGLAFGVGSYMDLTYANQPPGHYPAVRYVGDELYGFGQKEYQVLSGSFAVTKKGGRERYWAEWARLWSIIAEWVYEHDSEALQLGYIDHFTYKSRLTPEEERSFDIFGKIPRKYLKTYGIAAADAVHDVFAQLAKEPDCFQGIEWDFLELAVPVEVRDSFYARFGERGSDLGIIRLQLSIRIAGPSGGSGAYDEISPMALKKCPNTLCGMDWERWLLSIEGGDVIVLEAMFQALWAVMLLNQLPLDVQIIEAGGQFPKYRDPGSVYL